MFFKDIDQWEQKKLRLFKLVFSLLYFGATLLAPVIIVGCRYQIFKHASQYKLTGWGLLLAIMVFVVGIRAINKAVAKLPEITHKQQVLKYTILGVKALSIPVFILVVMYLFKSNFDLAYNTLWWCLLCYAVGIFIDYTCIKYIDKEYELRNKAKEKIEIDKRVDLLKK